MEVVGTVCGVGWKKKRFMHRLTSVARKLIPFDLLADEG